LAETWPEGDAHPAFSTGAEIKISAKTGVKMGLAKTAEEAIVPGRRRGSRGAVSATEGSYSDRFSKPHLNSVIWSNGWD